MRHALHTVHTMFLPVFDLTTSFDKKTPTVSSTLDAAALALSSRGDTAGSPFISLFTETKCASFHSWMWVLEETSTKFNKCKSEPGGVSCRIQDYGKKKKKIKKIKGKSHDTQKSYFMPEETRQKGRTQPLPVGEEWIRA